MHCVKTNNYFSVAGTSYLVVIRISALVGHIESRRSLAFSANHQLQCGDEIYNYYKQKLTSESYGWLVEKSRVGKSISSQASHRTVLESLPSHGSYYLITILFLVSNDRTTLDLQIV